MLNICFPSILNALDLASWSSVVAAEQKKGLVAGLDHLQSSKSGAHLPVIRVDNSDLPDL